MKHERPNMRLLPNGRYLVRTQAGFKKASKHWLKANDWEDIADKKPEGYPRSYPSVISFSFDYMRTNKFYAYCTHIKKHAANLRHQLQCLEPDLETEGNENAPCGDDCSSSK